MEEEQAGMRMSRTRYCVTGASGYLASWLVMRLLERGFSVRGTLRSLDDDSKTAHLRALPGAAERLELVKADLLDEPSLKAAVKDCDGVFAVAFPFYDPSKDHSVIVETATLSVYNLLRACKESSLVKRVVLTSTYYAAVQVPHLPLVVDESLWTSIEYCMDKKMPFWGYIVGKTMAEKAALDYANEIGLDLITILPSLVGGPFLPPTLPGSISFYHALMADVGEWLDASMEYMSYVHVDDTIRAHILLMEDSRAQGRYMCSAIDASISEVVQTISPILSKNNIPQPTISKSLNTELSSYKINTKKLQDLGFKYHYDSLHKIFEDTILELIGKGYLKPLQ